MKNRLFMKCSSYLVLLTFTSGILALPINASAEWRTNSSIKEDNDPNKKAILISIGAVLAVMGIIYAIRNSDSKKESEAMKTGELKNLDLSSGRASATLDNNFIKSGQRNYFKIPSEKYEIGVESLISHQGKKNGGHSETLRKRFTLSWDDWRISPVMEPQKNKRSDVEDSELFDEEVLTMWRHHFIDYDISFFSTYSPYRY